MKDKSSPTVLMLVTAASLLVACEQPTPQIIVSTVEVIRIVQREREPVVETMIVTATPSRTPPPTKTPAPSRPVFRTPDEGILIQEELSPEALEQKVDEIALALTEALQLSQRPLPGPTLVSTESRARIPRGDIGLRLAKGTKEGEDPIYSCYFGGWVIRDLGFSPAGERVVLVSGFRFPNGRGYWVFPRQSWPEPVPQDAPTWGGRYIESWAAGPVPIVAPLAISASTQCDVFRNEGLSSGGNPLGEDVLVGDAVIGRFVSGSQPMTIEEEDFNRLMSLFHQLSEKEPAFVLLRDSFLQLRLERIELNRARYE